MGMTVLQFLEASKGRAFTTEEIKKRGIFTSRQELRDLERKGVLKKEVTYLHNTVKKDLKGNKLPGTMAYKYSLVK